MLNATIYEEQLSYREMCNEMNQFSSRKSLFLLFGMLVCGIVFRLINAPIVGQFGDGHRWILSAQELFGERTSDLHPVHYSRILYRCSLSIWGGCFGFGKYSVAAYSWVIFLTSVLFIYSSATHLGGSVNCGLFAVFFFLFNPLQVNASPSTLPDGLANMLLTAVIWSLVRFYKTENNRFLILCGFLIGLVFSAKEYFVLSILPITATLLLFKDGLTVSSTYRRITTVFAACFLGLAVNPSMNFVDSGDFLGAFRGLEDYGDRLASGRTANPEESLIKQVIKELIERFRYIKWLTYDTGPIFGFFTILTILWLIKRIVLLFYTNEWRYFFLGSIILVFGFFLFFMPSKLNPFMFVEMQGGYLSVLMPPICIAFGMMLKEYLERKVDPASRFMLLIVLFLGAISSIFVLNDLTVIHDRAFSRGYRSQMEGIERFLKESGSGIKASYFADKRFQQAIPEEFHQWGIKLKYLPEDQNARIELVNEILSDREAAVFLPRQMVRSKLLNDIIKGDVNDCQLVIGKFQPIELQLAENKAERIKVMSPDSLANFWLSRFSLASPNQQLVGWCFRAGLENSKLLDSPEAVSASAD